MKFLLMMIMAICLPSMAISQTVDTFGPRLNEVETKIADLQREVVDHEKRITKLENVDSVKTSKASTATVYPLATTPVYSQPVYSAPVYSQPVRSTVYAQPVYSQPQRVTRTYSQPVATYSTPVRYSQPVYSQPTYRTTSKPTMTVTRNVPMASAPLRGRLGNFLQGQTQSCPGGVCPDR